MTNRIALFLLTSALTLVLPLGGAQAKEEHESATKSSSANSSERKCSGQWCESQDSSTSSSSSHSGSRFSHDDAREALRKGKVMPLTAILDIVAKRQPGTVIAVDLEFRHRLNRLIYEIDVIAEDGRRRELRLDARSGKILAVEDE
jgi:uncharacterized membrane protein YkoI